MISQLENIMAFLLAMDVAVFLNEAFAGIVNISAEVRMDEEIAW